MTPQTTTETAAPFALAEADEALFWQQDKMHFPDPLAPMESAMIQDAIGHGFSHGIRAYDAPLESMQVRTINGYQYQAMVPMTGTPEQMPTDIAEIIVEQDGKRRSIRRTIHRDRMATTSARAGITLRVPSSSGDRSSVDPRGAAGTPVRT